MTEDAVASTVVLGAGNPSMGDDGLGPAVLRRLAEGWHLPDEVRLVEGELGGLALLPVVEDAGRLIVVDAVTRGEAPGTPVTVLREHLPTRYGVRLSPHQVDLHDVFALAALRGTLPPEAIAIGLEPADCSWGNDLSAAVASGVGGVAARVVTQLEAWGHRCPRRVAGPCTS
jgi:hydrogenase maturation protease